MQPAAADLARALRRHARPMALLLAVTFFLQLFADLRMGHIVVACLIGTAAAMLVELAVLAAAFEHGRERRWGGAKAAAFVTFAGVACGVAVVFVLAALQRTTGLELVWGRTEAPFGVARVVALGAANGLVATAAWGLLVAYPQAAEDARLRAMEADRARRAAELARLRTCLEPHFLLNTLNAISGMVGDRPRDARKLLGCLGDLCRDALAEGDTQPLGAEIAWLRRYAEILEARHGRALAFRWEIDAAAEALHVPRLVLQPLVENAVKHGALARDGGGEVVVRARVEGGALVCVVEDDGPGVARDVRPGANGLAIVRSRLALRYDDAARLLLESSGGRTRAKLELPIAEGA